MHPNLPSNGDRPNYVGEYPLQIGSIRGGTVPEVLGAEISLDDEYGYGGYDGGCRKDIMIEDFCEYIFSVNSYGSPYNEHDYEVARKRYSRLSMFYHRWLKHICMMTMGSCVVVFIVYSVIGAQRDNGGIPTYEGGKMELSAGGDVETASFSQPALPFLADLSEPLDENDLLFFWQVPLSGDAVVPDIMGYCHGMVQASGLGGTHGYDDSEMLEVIQISDLFYVNVDTTSFAGIERSKKLDLASSGLADIVVSPLLRTSATIFTPQNRGRMFTLLRHPIERAYDMYQVTREQKEHLSEMSIEQYVLSHYAENNWLTRFLTGEMKGTLNSHHVKTAKEILQHKCLLGLLTNLEESVELYRRYFRLANNDNIEKCQERIVERVRDSNSKRPPIEKGSDEWRLLLINNKFDLQVYSYAEWLFEQQARLLT